MKAKRTLSVVLALIVVGTAVAVMFWSSGSREGAPPPDAPPSKVGDFAKEIRDRTARLKERIEQEKVKAEDAVNRYAAATAGRIDDLTVPAADLLRGLPCAVRVDAAMRVRRPACRIIHLRDYHFITRDLFNLEAFAIMGRPLTGNEASLHYQEYLLGVELVQLQQLALLRCLAKHHDLRTVYIERLTSEYMPEFHKRIAALKEAEPHQVTLRQQLADVQALLNAMTDAGKVGSERFIKAQAIEKEVTEMLEHHRLELLELGAPARLLVTGELQQVLPLDGAALLDAAGPRSGTIDIDPAAKAKRQDAMAQTLLKAGPVAVTVLGGSHDLTDALKRQGGACEYLRVTTSAYQEVAEMLGAAGGSKDKREQLLDMKFVRVPKGTFWMGGGSAGPPAKQVTIMRDFELAAYTVTQEQWQAVMGNNPSGFSRQGDRKDAVKDIPDADLKRFPVEKVSWDDVQAFLEKLNKREKGKGWLYRLPTEAEWEYACRGGATSKEECSFDFYFDKPTNDLSSKEANFNGGFPGGKGAKGPNLGRPAKVGSYQPNQVGLYDMHGNVYQWCDDVYNVAGAERVVRGGSWFFYGQHCKAAAREWSTPTARTDNLGFRLARVPSK